MSNSDQLLIENYLRGMLTVEEEKDFLLRIESDPTFRKHYLFEKQLFESLSEESWSYAENRSGDEVDAYTELYRSKETQELKNKISKVSEEYKASSGGSRKRWLWLSGAAVITILLVITLLMKPGADPEQLYLKYLNATEMTSVAIRGEEGDSLLIKAQQLFQQKKYNEALIILDDELNTSPGNRAVAYLLQGISEMELEKFQEAETSFNELIDSDLLDASKGYWYKALLYLKMNEQEQAKSVLEEIVRNTYFQHTQAKVLLSELE